MRDVVLHARFGAMFDVVLFGILFQFVIVENLLILFFIFVSYC